MFGLPAAVLERLDVGTENTVGVTTLVTQEHSKREVGKRGACGAAVGD